MFLIRMLSRQSESYQRNDGRTCVADIVEGVRYYRYGRRQNTYDQLAYEQQKIRYYAGDARQRGIIAPYLRILYVFSVLYEQFNKQISHVYSLEI